MWPDFFGRWVFKTKLAQVYPEREWVSIIGSFWYDQCPQFADSFQLLSTDRKRPVGQPLRWRDHRQGVTALKAEAAGYHVKRGARKPLLDTETEPGTAIQWSLDIPCLLYTSTSPRDA